MIPNIEFAIVDVETTGLFPKKNDRVIEIAVVRVDSNWHLLDEYTTLVNPQRDIGPTYIHGIQAKDVRHAPLFVEVGGDVLSKLAGAVFVAHNVHFDMRFMQSEMERIGCPLPHFPFLCTMQLAGRTDPSAPRRNLDALCRHFGIARTQAHSAHGDAVATAALLERPGWNCGIWEIGRL